MSEHDVKTILMCNRNIIKGVRVEYEGTYTYCDIADELFMDEEQMHLNDLNMKDAYRRTVGLLTSNEIMAIRAKYQISQKDLCILLGWGEKTISRYESHQIQDRAHDLVLKKIDQDPEWFISLLEDASGRFSRTSYEKYVSAAKAAINGIQTGMIEKILSIPEWMNEQAVAANINFSQLLQDALKEKLHLA